MLTFADYLKNLKNTNADLYKRLMEDYWHLDERMQNTNQETKNEIIEKINKLIEELEKLKNDTFMTSSFITTKTKKADKDDFIDD